MKVIIRLARLLFLYHCLILTSITLNAQHEINKDLDNSSEPKHIDENDLNYFTNTILINQYGEEMRFYEDLLLGKIVVINPFFSECTGICPVIHKTMARVQEHFGDRIGKDINLISITVDPDNDNPEVLKGYAEVYEAKRGWYFLTGDKENLETILKKLGKNVNEREQHDAIFLIGNIPTKLWKKTNGLKSTSDIIKVIDSVVNDSQ